MWINKRLFEMIVADNKDQQKEIVAYARQIAGHQTLLVERCTQKAKDDVTIDWLRHRVNALEKQNSILVMKTAGVVFPVPEIVPTRPGSISALPDFATMPSFEDVGPEEAERLGIVHEADGSVTYTK